MSKEIEIKLSFKARWELFCLRVKIGDWEKSRFRIILEELPRVFFPRNHYALFG